MRSNSLPLARKKSRLERSRQSKLMFSDPAFTENRELPFHRWVPWIAGFSGQFVSDVIRKHDITASPDSLVLDPFAGVGTTLVESKLKGLDTCGIEINPYAVLACRAKLRWEVDLETLNQQIAKFRPYARAVDGDSRNKTLEAYVESPSQSLVLQPKLKGPEGFRTREPFFDRETTRKVLLLKESVQESPSEVQDLFKVALGAILVKFSRYAYDPSLGRKSIMQIGSIKNGRVASALLERILEMEADLRWVKESILPKLPRKPTHKLYSKVVSKFRHRLFATSRT